MVEMLNKNELKILENCINITCCKCPMNEKQLNNLDDCCVGIISKSYLKAIEENEQLKTEIKSLKRQLSFLNIK